MKELFMSIDCEGKVTAKGFAGFNGEHLASSIVVSFNCDAPCADYFRMYFETSDGNNVFSEQLHIENGKIVYNIPFDVTTMGHTVYWQLCGYSMVEDQCSLIYKSEIVPVIFGGSISTDGNVATSEFVSSLENKLNKVEDFLDGFNILGGSVDYIDASMPPIVKVNKENNYKYSVDFTLPKCMDITKVALTIPSDSWDENLRSPSYTVPFVTRNSFIALKPKYSCIQEYNNCNFAIYSQKSESVSFCCSQLPTGTMAFDMLIVNC